MDSSNRYGSDLVKSASSLLGVVIPFAQLIVIISSPDEGFGKSLNDFLLGPSNVNQIVSIAAVLLTTIGTLGYIQKPNFQFTWNWGKKKKKYDAAVAKLFDLDEKINKIDKVLAKKETTKIRKEHENLLARRSKIVIPAYPYKIDSNNLRSYLFLIFTASFFLLVYLNLKYGGSNPSDVAIILQMISYCLALATSSMILTMYLVSDMAKRRDQYIKKQRVNKVIASAMIDRSIPYLPSIEHIGTYEFGVMNETRLQTIVLVNGKGYELISNYDGTVFLGTNRRHDLDEYLESSLQ